MMSWDVRDTIGTAVDATVDATVCAIVRADVSNAGGGYDVFDVVGYAVFDAARAAFEGGGGS